MSQDPYVGSRLAFVQVADTSDRFQGKVSVEVHVSQERVVIQKLMVIPVEGTPYVRTSLEAIGLDMDQAEDVAKALKDSIDAYQAEMRSRDVPAGGGE